MTIVVGLTGGIASGKTTITKILKRKKIPVHDSDSVVFEIYNNPSKGFINFLKKIKLDNAIVKKKINKKKIREEIFSKITKKKRLEKYLHLEVSKSRISFLNNQKKLKTKIVFLDIPLLFENKLNNICDFVVLLIAPTAIRKKRALNRSGMDVKILNKIIKAQLGDNEKKKRSDFIIYNSGKKSLLTKKIFDIVKIILEKK